MRDTVIVEHEVFKLYFGFKEETTPLFYKPLGLVSRETFDKLTESNKYLVELKKSVEGVETLEILFNVIGDVRNTEEDPFTAECNMTGITEPLQISMDWLNVSIKILKPHLNFIYEHAGQFYGMTGVVFKNNIKRMCYSEEDKKIREDSVKQMLNDMEEEGLAGIFDYLEFRPMVTSVGRILTVLLPNAKASVISDIVTYIKATTSAKLNEATDEHIHIVDSDVITYYYNEKNYCRNCEGTPLGNSCMRGSSNTEQIKFYDDNPDAVQLIVYIKDKKLEGRALLWKTMDGKFIVDRIYYASSPVATEIAKFCKIKGFKTCYSSNCGNYGLDMANHDDILIKLNQIDNREYQPYYDSMKFIDILNGIISTRQEGLVKYGQVNNLDYAVFRLENYDPGNMYRNRPWDENIYPIKVGGASEHKVICDAEGKRLQSFKDITITQRPFKGLMPKGKTVCMYPDKVITTSSFVREMIHNYNCIRNVLVVENDKLVTKLADKKDVIYSHFHKSFILKQDSFYIKDLKTVVLKQISQNKELREQLKLLKVRRLYVNKLVRVKPEGLTFLQQQFALLPGTIKLSCIRSSRTFMLTKDNVTLSSVLLKDIPVPLKYIQIIKK
jgi:hypothetical protein